MVVTNVEEGADYAAYRIEETLTLTLIVILPLTPTLILTLSL